jgi:hypothetical protein
MFVTPGEIISPREFSARIPFYEILGDSLPDGRYYFTAELSFQLGHSKLSLPAGEAYLTSAIDPLPSERVVNDIRFAAETAIDDANDMHLKLTVTNTGTERAFLTGSAGINCSSQLFGFSSPARRNQRWLHDADWVLQGCPLTIPPSWLAPGQSRDFTATITDHNAASGIHPVLVLWLNGEPRRDEVSIVLAAGAAG